MICYVVIDTNVLVSALLSKYDNAATVQVLKKLFDKEIKLVYSKEIIDEYSEVLSRKKFKFSQSLVDELIDFIRESGEFVEPASTGKILLDMKDLPFYEVVMEKQDDNAYLVTGNIKHFPNKSFIVTPREFMEIIDHIN